MKTKLFSGIGGFLALVVALTGCVPASTGADGQAAGGGIGSMYSIVLIVAMVAIFYFMLIRPQRKEQKRKNDMFASMAIGDTVLTTSGFYGILIDIADETTVIVEFGNNKNCRIPMQKLAIAAIEKPETAVKAPTPAPAPEKKEEQEKDSAE